MGEPTSALTCVDCTCSFTRRARRGPAPKRCPPCTAAWDRKRNSRFDPGPLPSVTTCLTCGAAIAQSPRSARSYCDPCGRARQARRSADWLASNPQARSAKWSRKKHRRRALLTGAEAETFDPREIYERDGWTCQLCGRPVDRELRYPDPGSVSLDHVIPLSRGGAHTRGNTACAHLLCNVLKNDDQQPEDPVMPRATKDTPRILRHTRTNEEVRCVDEGERLQLTSTRGYRDVTDEQSSPSASSTGSSSATSGSDVPPQSANKPEWVEHAVSRGADRTTAEGMSKPDLIAAYGA